MDDFGVGHDGGLVDALSESLHIHELIDLTVAAVPIGDVDAIALDHGTAYLDLPAGPADVDPFLADVAAGRLPGAPISFVLPNPFSR